MPGSTTVEALAAELVGVLRALSGTHGRYRPVHAKGLMASGRFRSSEAAPSISRAAHFQGQDVPAIVRFSNGDGHPSISDVKPNVRAMSVKFVLPDGSHADILGNTIEGLISGTPEGFLEFLKSLLPGPSGPDPEAFPKALAAYPTAAEYFMRLARRPIPASYAQTSYYGIHSFRFVAADGSARYGRYQWEPESSESFLSVEEAASRSPNFLSEELAERLKSKSVAFRLMVQIAADGDSTDDCTRLWPEDRPRVNLGRLEVSALAENSVRAEQPIVFDPNNLTDGIEPSMDPILLIRRPAYQVSFSIRSTEAESAPY